MHTCLQVLFELHPLKAGATPWNVVCCAYLAIFAAFWAWNLAEAVRDLPFCLNHTQECYE